jgi:hypothetical protein
MDPKEVTCRDEHCLDEIDQNGFSDVLNTKMDLSGYVKFLVTTL